MSLKAVISPQYQENIEAARGSTAQLQTPTEGWLRTMRKALGMSGAQLARRMGMTRGAISINEKAELEGAITLKTLQQMAAAMDARFVYAIIPERNIEDILDARARSKAKALVKQASIHMALEDQALSTQRLHAEIERLAKELLDKPSNLWDEP